MVSITFRDYKAPEGFVRDSPGITVKDNRFKWECVFDDLESSALYFFNTPSGIKVSLKWSRDEGYTSSLTVEGAEIELNKGFTRQHIDLAKADTIDGAFEFFMGVAEEIDKEKYEEYTSNNY